jgi:hypothetical protein
MIWHHGFCRLLHFHHGMHHVTLQARNRRACHFWIQCHLPVLLRFRSHATEPSMQYYLTKRVENWTCSCHWWTIWSCEWPLCGPRNSFLPRLHVWTLASRPLMRCLASVMQSHHHLLQPRRPPLLQRAHATHWPHAETGNQAGIASRFGKDSKPLFPRGQPARWDGLAFLGEMPHARA